MKTALYAFVLITMWLLVVFDFVQTEIIPEIIKEVPVEQASTLEAVPEEIEEIDRALIGLSVGIASHQFYIDNPEKQNKDTGDTERNQAIIEKYLGIQKLLIHYRDTLRE